jgi:SSS family solute:Na+ symporter
MMQAWWLFVLCTVIYFLVSYLTERPPEEITSAYTWAHPLSTVKGKITGFNDVRIYVIILIITLIILYATFS